MPLPSSSQAAKVAEALSRDVHYTVDEKQKSVLLTEDGYEAVEDVLQVGCCRVLRGGLDSRFCRVLRGGALDLRCCRVLRGQNGTPGEGGAGC